MKYIDSEKLIAEIERLLAKAKNDEEKTFAKKDAAGHLMAVTKTAVCAKIKKLISTLQHEQPEVVLEMFDNEVTKIWGKLAADSKDSIACLHIETFNETARHFFELGQRTKYQQDREEFAKLKAKEWQDGYDEGYAKGIARKEE